MNNFLEFTENMVYAMKSDVLIRIALFLALGLGSGWMWGCAENAGAAAQPPKLMVVGGETVDWGEVGGGELKHALKIVNVGGDTLHIVEVKPSCGCTTAPLDKKMLLAGDTATINLTMDVAGRSGETTKTLNITTNDSTSPVTTVHLKANVVQEVKIEPTYFHIDDVEPGKEGSGSIVLRNVGKSAVTIEPPTEEDVPLMAVRFDMLKPVTLQPNDSLVVKVFATPLNAGASMAHYIFKTNSKLTPQIKVPLSVATKADSPTGVAESPQVIRSN